MFVSLQAKHATPAPGKVIFDVEANSKTLSGLPAFAQISSMFANGTKSPSNSCTQYALSQTRVKSGAAVFIEARRAIVSSE